MSELETVSSSHDPSLSSDSESDEQPQTATLLDENKYYSEITHIPEYFSSIPLLAKRCLWLIGLLILQSFSSWILAAFDDLLKKHFVVALFLTMLIGTGGNAGSQSLKYFPLHFLKSIRYCISHTRISN